MMVIISPVYLVSIPISCSPSPWAFGALGASPWLTLHWWWHCVTLGDRVVQISKKCSDSDSDCWQGESLSLAHPSLVMTLWSDLIMICQIAWLHLIWELLNEKHPRPVDNLQDLIVLHHNTPHHIWLSYHLLMTSRTSRTSQCYIIIIISPVYDLQDLQKAPTPHREGA